MERNLELVKQILIEAEKQCSPTKALFIHDIKIEGHEHESIWYHCDLLFEAGLLLPNPVDSAFVINRLTWDGHEFLACSRNSRVWKAMTRLTKPLSVRAAMLLMEKLIANQAFWLAFWHYILGAGASFVLFINYLFQR